MSVNASNSIGARIAIVAVVICSLLFGWYVVRWQLGFMLADLSSPTEPNAKAIGQLAVDLAPRDPLANWLLVNAAKNDFTAESIENSIKGIENVVRFAPYNFSWWIELGRTYEQSNQPEKAEKAFLRAVELAPNYTYPHWQLGNFYLRSGDETRAFGELRKAAENNAVYREQVFSIAWDYYEQNPQRLEELAGDSPEVRAGLARFYAVKERAADSLRMWNTLTPEEKEKNSDVAKVVAQGLYDKKFYRQAVAFVADLGMEPKAKAETVLNGSFEDPIGESENVFFDWKVTKAEKIDIKLDTTQKKSGNRSLRMSFNSFLGGIFYNTFQIVAVEPSAEYILSFWVKTDSLNSGGMPTFEVVDAVSGKIIATSESFPTGTNNWQQMKIEFSVPEDSEGISIRT